MRRVYRRPEVAWRYALLSAGLALLLAPVARGGNPLGTSCTVSATPVSFGTYNPLTPTGLGSTGTVTVSCTALVLPGTATVIVDLDKGTGPGASFAGRLMQSGAHTLGYNLYIDATHTQIWGDGTGGSLTDSLTVNIPLLGTGTQSATVYGLMPAMQDVAPGPYTDTITVTANF